MRIMIRRETGAVCLRVCRDTSFTGTQPIGCYFGNYLVAQESAAWHATRSVRVQTTDLKAQALPISKESMRHLTIFTVANFLVLFSSHISQVNHEQS